MKSSALDFFVCPTCKQPALSLCGSDAGASEIAEGELACSQCGNTYPIIGGIPRFVPPGNYAESFGFQWNRHRVTQLDSHTGLPISRNRLFEVTGWSTRLPGQTILEAGSGAGRFTEVLATTGATILSMDYSTAVDANFTNHGYVPNLHLFQGDIFNIPLRPHSFDKVLCLGVIQHTPDPLGAVRSLVHFLRPGGELVVDVYARRVTALLSWKYLLRPLTSRMDRMRLYDVISRWVPKMVPLAATLRMLFGRPGARLLPIVEYSHLGLPPDLNREWAILDTFDMYSAVHDHPQSLATMRQCFRDLGMSEIDVRDGPNGVIARGRLLQGAEETCAALSA
jgi:SAM-dependent methyltransferase